MRPKVYLAICAIIKNEAEYLQEWLEFHRLVGVSRFYLYDNDSSDQLQEVLAPYIASGVVVYHHLTLRPGQLPAYVHYLEAYRAEAVWTAFIDADEFLFGTKEDDLREILLRYRQYDALGVNWLIYGSSGHERKQAGLLIENYTRRSQDSYPANRHIKSIVQNDQTLFVANPHVFITARQNIVTENFQPLELNHESLVNSVQTIRINHYVSKSVSEAKIKWEQGRADSNQKREWSFFAERLAQNDLEDRAICRFVPELKKRLPPRAYLESIFNLLQREQT